MAWAFGKVTRLALHCAVGAAAACNGVLGIEQAGLDPDAAAAGSSSGGTAPTGGTGASFPETALPVPGCIVPDPDCATCVASGCRRFELARCLSEPSCREALDFYRTCSGAACMGGEDCWEALVIRYEATSQVTDLVGCLSDECMGRCERSTLVTMCELYCACMTANCGGKFSTVAACMQECALHDLSTVYCRKMHCEFLNYHATTAEVHCDHAVGLRGQCATPPAGNPGCDKVFSGFACDADSDCCSGRCNGEVCD